MLKKQKALVKKLISKYKPSIPHENTFEINMNVPFKFHPQFLPDNYLKLCRKLKRQLHEIVSTIPKEQHDQFVYICMKLMDSDL